MHVAKLLGTAAIVGLSMVGLAAAQSAKVVVDINKISSEGIGEKIGTVTITEAKQGLSFEVKVTGLSAGPHGFHVHETGNCAAVTKDGKATAGAAAGSHYDPEGKKHHLGPAGAGHKGDLPLLEGKPSGIDQTVVAPRLTMAEVRGRALVIHEGGDTYSDTPELGGGGSRIACGMISK